MSVAVLTIPVTDLPGQHDFAVVWGDTFQPSPIVYAVGATEASATPVDLTGYSAKLDVRTLPRNSGTLIIALSTINGRITLGATAGTITLSIAAADMATLTPGTYYYSLVLVDGATVQSTLLEGR